jgi:hypothetical protein
MKKNNFTFFTLYPYHTIIVVFGMIIFSCKKDDNPILNTTTTNPSIIQGVDFEITYSIDNNALMYNHPMYLTPAGYNYSITNLCYYISRIELIKADTSYTALKNHQYIDANKSETNTFTIENIAEGDYIGVKFYIGLDSTQNISFFLPPTNDNNNMQWPQLMGGGYHFLKLEGNYIDNSATYGYAMHLGTNNCLIPIKLFSPIHISNNVKTKLKLKMNINEWFKNPHLFDFNLDANNIMGDSINMKKIAENGADVFTINP